MVSPTYWRSQGGLAVEKLFRMKIVMADSVRF